MKVLGNRVLLKVEKIYTKDEEGNEKMDISREGKVVQSGNEEIKKGDTVYYLPFGGVQIDSLSTKKHMVLCVDADDVFMVL